MYQDPTSEWLADNGKVPFRLARYNTPPRTARMKQVLKKLGLTPDDYCHWSNEPLRGFAKQNEGWSQRAWEVLILENLDGIRGVYHVIPSPPSKPIKPISLLETCKKSRVKNKVMS